MARNLIIGTAGHIDHGKTALVKALTGRDTDRLAEEKDRGISIDLGFAPFKLSDGSTVGIVDVPGHENFIRNMMAGATGVDLALLVVAADDGVMPQTREHLAILDLLGVSRGVVAVTKIDLVDAELIPLVVDEVDELLDGTLLEGSPIVPVSAVTGEGLEELRLEIELAASEVRLKDEELPARLPIDRVFTLRGIGTVVTGTLWSGTLRNGQRLELLPEGREVRVRSLQVHDAEREVAAAGERVAANLAGVSRTQAVRGDVLAEPGRLRPTYMLDARVVVLKDRSRPLKRGTRIRFHHGTREVMGRIYPMGAEAIAPGERLPAQLRLEALMTCAPGDRFVLRSYSPVTTVGGGTVVDAHPRKHKVMDPGALEEFSELESGDPERVIATHLARADKPVSAREVVLLSSLAGHRVASALEALVGERRVLELRERKAPGKAPSAQTDPEGMLYISASRYEGLKADIIGFLTACHREQPLAEGVDKETMKTKLLINWDSRSAEALFDRMGRDDVIESAGKLVRLPGTGASVTEEQSGLIDTIVERIAATRHSPPSLGELAGELGVPRPKLAELLGVAERENRVVRVSPELYFSPAAMAEIETQLRGALAAGDVTVSGFRDLIQTSRKYALPLLEYFDRKRLTVRVGDVRRLRA
jgi:selenocysteine-specific elongation factor